MDDILKKYTGIKPTVLRVESGRDYRAVIGDVNNGLLLNLEFGVSGLKKADNFPTPLSKFVLIVRGIVRGKEYIELLDCEDRDGYIRTKKQAFQLGYAIFPSPTDALRLLTESTFYQDLEKSLKAYGGDKTAEELRLILSAPTEELYQVEELSTNKFEFNF